MSSSKGKVEAKAKAKRKAKAPLKAKQWEEQVHQNLVAWTRTILHQCIDIAIRVFPPPAGLMNLFVKHGDHPVKPVSRPSAGKRASTSSSSKKEELVQQFLDDHGSGEDDVSPEHDPHHPDFPVPDDSNNLEGYTILPKTGYIRGSEDLEADEKEDEVVVQVENAMDVPTAEDLAFLASESEEEEEYRKPKKADHPNPSGDGASGPKSSGSKAFVKSSRTKLSGAKASGAGSPPLKKRKDPPPSDEDELYPEDERGPDSPIAPKRKRLRKLG